MSVILVPGQKVDVPDITCAESVSLPSASTAVVVVDMQNDFIRPEGSLHVPTAGDTVPGIVGLLKDARAAEARIVYTQDTQVEGDPEFRIWPRHCVKGSWGWEIIEELTPGPGDLICQKNRYDGFYGTWLEHFLRSVWAVEHLVIVGTVSNICVLHTAASAGLRWFHVVVPADGISALTEFDQALTLRQVSSLYAGDVLMSWRDVRFDSIGAPRSQ